jgi:RNA polymerase sigma-70 factor (TIGR02960 family)
MTPMSAANHARDAARDEIAAALAGDEPAFAALAERHRRELHVHCYRMLASFDDAEDAVQETLLRAWRARDTFDGSSLVRAWLYRIATNVCLDMLRRRGRRAATGETLRDLPWIQPYPDVLLDELAPPAPSEQQPDAVAVERETISLVFLAALQALPPRQRAALIARDVLGWHAAETADLLETSVPAANSALQRARATMQTRLPSSRSEWATVDASDRERELLAQFIDAHERGDAALAVSIAAHDLRITMPPNPYLYQGRDTIAPLLADAMRMGEWRLVATSANRMPTAASYFRAPGDTVFRAFKLDVLRVRDGSIAEITTFGPQLFAAFGLPATSPDPGQA